MEIGHNLYDYRALSVWLFSDTDRAMSYLHEKRYQTLKMIVK